MSYAEFLAYADEDTLAEWKNGAVLMTSPASLLHQHLTLFLGQILSHFVEHHNLGVVIVPPFQMKLAECGRVPDLLFVATAHREFWRLLFLERFWPRATYPLEQWPTEQPRRVEAIKGAALLLRRAALDQVGLLDESYFIYTEEVDLCQRLGLAGWELWYAPQAVVTHYGGASSSQMAEAMYLQLYRSKLQFYRKFGGEGRARRPRFLFALAYVPRWAIAAVTSLVMPAYRAQAHRYRRLLAELPGM